MVEEAVVAAAAAIGLASYAVRGKSSSLIAPSVWHGDRNRRALALTFDDGPSESTPALLEVLSKHNIRATFFLCGRNVSRLRSIAREVAAAGHEIGNHTDSHPALYFKSSHFIYSEMARAQEAIEQIAGVTPKLFRAPYGVRWPGLGAAQEKLQLTGVMWTAIGLDWKLPAAGVSRRLLAKAANGAIFCLHDGRALRPSPDIRATMEAVELMLPVLKDRGFSFETATGLTAGSPRSEPA